MTTQTSSQTTEYEETLTNIVRTLSPERAAQLVDFARFLEAQALLEELAEAESMAEIEAENAEWDTLLTTDEAQDVLDKLADEALEEHRAGKTRPIRFSDEGQMIPG